jgi:outer membrane lipoprotein-sorting protein
MKRLVIMGCCLAAVAAAGTADGAEKAAPAANLSAAQIVEKNVQARGGLKAWQAVSSLKMSGEMDAGGKADVKVPFVLALKRPHKSRLEITFAGQNAVQTYDGTQGWKVRPFLNRDDVEPFTPAEARSAAAAAELDGPLIDYAKKGARVELAGTEKVEGRKAYKLKLTAKDGVQRFVWVDASTFLESKISGEPRKLDGRPHAVSIYYRDFRTVNGLKVPFKLETAVEGVKQHRSMVISSVTVNPPLEDTLFAKPGSRGGLAKGG